MGIGELQPMHLLLILVIVLLVFGPSKLGDLGSTLGKSIKEFRHAMKETDEETPPKPPSAL